MPCVCNPIKAGKARFAAHPCLECRERNIEPTQMQELIQQLKFIPVFTAHPTEARRPYDHESIAESIYS